MLAELLKDTNLSPQLCGYGPFKGPVGDGASHVIGEFKRVD